MKKVTIILICLVMCFSMAFPASAAVQVNKPEWAKFVDLIVEKAIANAPVGYPYVLFSISNTPIVNALCTLNVLYFSVPSVPNTSITYYWSSYQFYTSGVNSGTYTTIRDKEKNTYVVCWKDTSGSLSVDFGGKGGYGINYFIVDRSTAKFYNTDTIQPNNPWHVLLDAPAPDITALQSLLTTAKAKQSTGYTGTSWQALQTAITAADNLLSTTGYTQTQVDEAKNSLQAALDGLTLLPDTSALLALLNQAKAVTNDGYNSATWQALQSAITSVQNLLNGTDYTAAQVESARSALQAALNGLESLPPVEELKELLVEADEIEDIGYTAPTWTRFDNARADGHALVASVSYTAYQVQSTTTELRVSMDGLTLATATEIPEPKPRPKGYDLGTGDVSGYLSIVPDIVFNYVKSPVPVAFGIFAIIFSIKFFPYLFGLVIGALRRY